MIKIVLASRNQSKILAVGEFFTRRLKTSFSLLPISCGSSVSRTPYSNDEIILGAINRIKSARLLEPEADYWIGAEGGVFKSEMLQQLMLGCWVVVENALGKQFIGSSRFIPLPHKISLKLTPELELHSVVELTDYPQSLTKKFAEIGTNGLVSQGVYTRTREFYEALEIAFSQIGK